MTAPLNNAEITVSRVPCAEGKPVYLTGNALAAARLRRDGRTALGPDMVEALAAVHRVFPGARVVEMRKRDIPHA